MNTTTIRREQSLQLKIKEKFSNFFLAVLAVIHPKFENAVPEFISEHDLGDEDEKG